MNRTTHVGMDVHKEKIQVGMLRPEAREPVLWEVRHDPEGLRRLARRLQREGEVVCCYEAGPCGYTVHRTLETKGIRCLVVAPSLVPKKPGERVKTDKRDARKLTELLRADLLTEVRPPTPREEALRDLSRCRADARADLLRARHRLSKFLLRRGMVWREGGPWTQRHRAWLLDLGFEFPEERSTFDDYLMGVSFQEERVKLLDQKLQEAAQREPYKDAVGWLRCFRGIDTVTAVGLVAEIHDIRRFSRVAELESYLGLVPGEHSSGDRVRRGPITKAGNGHARRLLVEASWHARHRPAVSKALRNRRKGQPPWVIAKADQAMRRLHKKYWSMVHHGKDPSVAVVAVAREMVGFLWAVMGEAPTRVA